MRIALPPLQEIPGFESTDYAFLRGSVVWVGNDANTDHPRNARRPWSPAPILFDAARLRVGAQTCLSLLQATPAKGVLLWLAGRPLPFPLNHAAARFDAIRGALERNELPAFEAAALRVLGLGHGLTPSGDDFVGGILFALKHAPRDAWRAELPAVLAEIRKAAATSTNVISAALLGDLIDGASYRALHELLAALQDNAPLEIASATQTLLRVGASSGADMLAGLLVALLTKPCQDIQLPT
jgi:Protein of unknown function (DUF2877)